MPGWLISLLGMFAGPVIQWALMFLEQQNPGLKPILDQILAWLRGQQSQGNTQAVQQLATHVDKMCSGVACPADLVKMP